VDVIVTTTASDRAASNQVHKCKQVRGGRKLGMHSVSLPATPLWGGGSVIFLGAKTRQKVTQFSGMGIFCRKWPFLKRKVRQILTKNWGGIKFMPPDCLHTIMSFLEKSGLKSKSS